MPATLLLSLSRYVDYDGKVQWIEVLPEVAALLKEVEPKLKERLLKNPSNIEKVRDRTSGNPWEGPHFAFTWLVGESRTWAGESWIELEGQVYCGFCLGSKLPSHAYCLQCNACGRDDLIRGPSEAELKCRAEPRRVYGPKGSLKGGKG